MHVLFTVGDSNCKIDANRCRLSQLLLDSSLSVRMCTWIYIICIDLKACNGACRSLFRFHYGRGLSISMSKWYAGRIIIMSSIIVNIAITHQLATKDGPQDDVNVVDVY